MTHAILSLGWFDTSFESLIKGTDVFLLKKGEPAQIVQTQKVTPDIDGVVFYYMQVPHEEGEEQFVAVRVQFRGVTFDAIPLSELIKFNTLVVLKRSVPTFKRYTMIIA